MMLEFLIPVVILNIILNFLLFTTNENTGESFKRVLNGIIIWVAGVWFYWIYDLFFLQYHASVFAGYVLITGLIFTVHTSLDLDFFSRSKKFINFLLSVLFVLVFFTSYYFAWIVKM